MRSFIKAGLCGGLLAVGFVGALLAQTTRVSPVTTITCTNQFLSGLASTGIFTCSSIGNNQVTNAMLATAGANTMKGNWTGSTANEADNSIPSCPDSGGNHLNYVSGTGITCGTGGGGATSIIVGTTTISGGTNTKILYDNSGVLGEYTVSGSGDVAMTTSPAFTTPALGVASATTVNKVALTTPATGSTLTIADGKTLTDTSGVGAVVLKGATGGGFAAATAADMPTTTLGTGTSVSLAAPRQYYVCTGTCTVTPPVPAAGYEFCALNDNNISTVITMAALGSSARYENTARTAYGTAGTGTQVSGGAVGDKVCIVGLDSTHYLTVSSTGTWTAN